MVAWYVDNKNLIHMDPVVNDTIIQYLKKRFGELKSTIGNKRKFLRVDFTIQEDKKIGIYFIEQVKGVITSFGEILSGTASSPSAQTFLTVNEEAGKLNEDKRNIFHSVTVN